MIEKIENIVISMKLDPIIFSALGNRIYIGEPIEEQTSTYLTINIVTQIQPFMQSNRTRLEFRFIGGNLGSLSLIEKIVSQYLVRNFQSLGFYNIEVDQFSNGYDDKKTPVIIRDYIFYMVTHWL